MPYKIDVLENSELIKPCNSYCRNCNISVELRVKDILVLCSEKQTVSINRNDVKLPHRSFRVLCALLRWADTPVSIDFLNAYGWPDKAVVRNNLPVTISEIRTLLSQTNIEILNIRRFGYQLNTAADIQDNMMVANV